MAHYIIYWKICMHVRYLKQYFVHLLNLFRERGIIKSSSSLHSIWDTQILRLKCSNLITAWFHRRSIHTIQVDSVILGTLISQNFNIATGVPQGSHSGAFLFKVFIIDIDKALIIFQFRDFADDIKIFDWIVNIFDTSNLQVDVTYNFFERININDMTLNPNKCLAISFSSSSNQIQFVYRIGCGS